MDGVDFSYRKPPPPQGRTFFLLRQILARVLNVALPRESK